MKRRLSFTTLFVNLVLVVVSLKLENVTIPQYGVKDGGVSLLCHFHLQDDTLLVLKWYKDEKEFFRYSPQIRPPILVFPVDGVSVNETQSGLNHVVLKNISLKTSGTYKCEVSADKSFRTLSEQGDMIVIAPPSSDPEITGIHPALSVGDTLNANCTSFHSQPAASLMFYINEEKAETNEIREYLPVSEADGLESSILGLHFLVESRHFKNRANLLELKCTATIGNSYRVKKITVGEANINAQPSVPGHNRLLLSSGANCPQEYPSFFFFLLLITCLFKSF